LLKCLAGFLKPLESCKQVFQSGWGAAAGFSKLAWEIYIYLRFSSGFRKADKNSSRRF
jgi:hypothetical protein